ncbi:MAG: succinate dehydrogenase cytochrome b subunit [Verrucomicrobia bacterium]|nr:succinate dehydrogenase cytochrome b subunit [Verrucomicrobiota bacterium]
MSALSCCNNSAPFRFWNSSIGKKIIVALTGIILVGYLAGHLVGNLLIFQGEHAFNEYAHFLQTMLHGYGVWIARIVLLGTLVLHVVATIQLTLANRIARNIQYQCPDTVTATVSSRMMIWSGSTILAFIVFHILHYTVRVSPTLAELGENNPHAMVITGFSNVLVSLFYIVAISLLCSHLSHGVGSIFQTLGLRSHKTALAIDLLSRAYALAIWLGFISIPVAIMVFGFGK